MPEIGVGLVGYGLAGRAFHSPFINAVDGLRLAAIVTTDPGRRARAATEHPEAVLLATPDALFEQADVELVVVAAPNSLHAPIGTQALAAGRHVVVDKPIGLDVREAEGLMDAAAKSGRILSVYQNRRWDGDFLTLRRLIDAAALGPIDSLESRFERAAPVGPEWRELASESGGPLRDLGSHLIDQSLLLFGPARRVWAQIDRRRPGSQVEDSVFVAIDHGGGVRSRLWTSLIASRTGPRFRLRGLTGEFVKDGLDIQEEQLVAGMAPGEPGFGEEPAERWGLLHGAAGAATPIRTERGHYSSFYEGMRDAMTTNGRPPVDPLDALRTLRVIEAADRASAAGVAQLMSHG
jgi:predicted dehydrogenase